MSSCLSLYLYTEACTTERVVLLRLGHLCSFDLSAYTPRMFESRTF